MTAAELKTQLQSTIKDPVQGNISRKIISGLMAVYEAAGGPGDASQAWVNTQLANYTPTAQLSIDNWNTAYGWGDHGQAGYLTSVNNANWVGADLEITNGGTGASSASAARINLGLDPGTDIAAFNDSRILNGQTAYNWGDHGQAGYALASAIPTNNNQLTNGAGYQTAAQVSSIITADVDKTFVDGLGINAVTFGSLPLVNFMLFEDPATGWVNGKVASYNNGNFVPVDLPSFSYNFNIQANAGATRTIADGETITFVDGVNTTVTRTGLEIQVNATDTNNYADSLAFNTANGILTVGRSGLADLTVNLDGRYRTAAQTLSFSLGVLDLTDSPSVDLQAYFDGRYVQSVNVYDGWNLAATTGGSTLISENETVTFVDGLNTTATRLGNTIQIDAAFSETDTLQSVTDRGATTTQAITVGGLTSNGSATIDTYLNLYSGGTTGVLKNTVNNGAIVISGGSTTADGANITLFGGDNGNYFRVRIGLNQRLSLTDTLTTIYTNAQINGVLTISTSNDNPIVVESTDPIVRAVFQDSNNSSSIQYTGSTDLFTINTGLSVSGNLTTTGTITENGQVNINAGNFSSYFTSALSVQGNIALTDDPNNFIVTQEFGSGFNSDSVSTIAVSSGEGLIIKDSDSTGNAAVVWLSFKDSVNARYGYVGLGSSSNQDLFINSDVGDVVLRENTGGVGLRLSSTSITLSRNTTIENTLSVAQDINHLGDTDNYHRFTTDTQNFVTGGSSGILLTNTDLTLSRNTQINGDTTTTGNIYLDKDRYLRNSATGFYFGVSSSNDDVLLRISDNDQLRVLGNGGANVLVVDAATGVLTENGNVNINAGNFSSYFTSALSVQGNLALTDDPNNFIVNQVFDAGLTSNGTLSVAQDINHLGDTDNYHRFTTDTQNFATGGSTGILLTNSALTLARNTTINGDADINGDFSAYQGLIRVNDIATGDGWANTPSFWIDIAGNSPSYYAFGITTLAGKLFSINNSGGLIHNGDSNFNGNLTATGTTHTLIGEVVIQRSAGGLVIQDNNNSATSAAPYMEFKDQTGLRLGFMGYGSSSNNDWYIRNETTSGLLRFATNSTDRWRIDASGNLIAYSAYNLTTTGTITASGGNSSNWNTAFSWGNHALQGYLIQADLADYLDLTSTGTQTLAGRLDIAEYLGHSGDSNTYIRLTTDRIRLQAGGLVMLDFEEVSGVRRLGYGGTYNTSYNHYFTGTAHFTGDISGNFVGQISGVDVSNFAKINATNNFTANQTFEANIQFLGASRTITGLASLSASGNLVTSGGHVQTGAPAASAAKSMKFGSYTADLTLDIIGYIDIEHGGTARKLAVLGIAPT